MAGDTENLRKNPSLSPKLLGKALGVIDNVAERVQFLLDQGMGYEDLGKARGIITKKTSLREYRTLLKRAIWSSKVEVLWEDFILPEIRNNFHGYFMDTPGSLLGEAYQSHVWYARFRTENPNLYKELFKKNHSSIDVTCKNSMQLIKLFVCIQR